MKTGEIPLFFNMLPQENRLRKEKEIEKVFKIGKSVYDPVCGFKFLPNGLLVSRFAFMVGTKIYKSAVKRNRLRRQIREIIHLNLSKIKPGFDFTFIARPEAKEADYQVLENRIISGLKRERMI